MADRLIATITDLTPDDEPRIQQTAALLVAAFQGWPDTFPDLAGALEEVRESFAERRISRVALDVDGAVVGWVGGISEYDGNAWELHPLAVRPDWQRRGVGRALVADLEARVRERGGTTVYLGTDDEDGRTSLANTDLYPNVWEHITRIQNLRHHPYAFYLRCGYAIVGVIPDANGPGKPDILMAKRVTM
ncbi:MAG: GNAT family N-acetyltransferase [Thermomicrobiales bacterium]